MSSQFSLSVILLRRLMPARWYPGRARVGSQLAELTYPAGVRVYDGVDWYWGRTIVKAVRLLRMERPNVVVLQWWTGTVLHTLLTLALISKWLGARIVIEFHEVQDTGEIRMPCAKRYVDSIFPLLLRLLDGVVVHSEYDRNAVCERYDLADKPLMVVPHGPYTLNSNRPKAEESSSSDVCTLLYFGVIRPFKGVEDLVRAFDQLPESEAARYRLIIAGETWEGHTLPAELIASSRYPQGITFVNRYVHDDEVRRLFDLADVVVLPYHRSSASGPLSLAMSAGLPVIVTTVGGLVEAAQDYAGAVFVPPHDVRTLSAALLKAPALRGRRFQDPHSWECTVDRYSEIFRLVHGCTS
jgi:glycosyltransferase involved in cell wall biosynthesis